MVAVLANRSVPVPADMFDSDEDFLDADFLDVDTDFLDIDADILDVEASIVSRSYYPPLLRVADIQR